MILKQYYLQCLSHASYLIGDESTGRAVVIDPQRDVSQYLADAEEAGLHIERVIETHYHADFLSGHLEIAKATGAVISYGEAGKGKAEYPVDWLADGQRLSLGDVQLQVMATPGHTPESICVVVYEHADDTAPYGIFTGDTLFIGDVGRPDLLGGFGLKAEDLASMLFHSLHDKVLTLPDATQVFPAHGAGSACGKALSDEKSSTLGQQRATNYALAPMSEDEFVATVTEGQPAAPGYFPFAAVRNRQGHDLLTEDTAPVEMSLDAVLAAQSNGAVLLDTRSDGEFATGHLRGAVNVGLDGRFSELAGQVVAPSDRIVLVGEPATALEAKVRLARIGFDNVAGYLDDLVSALVTRPDLAERSSRVTVTELDRLMSGSAPIVLIDVRNPGEVAAGIIPGARVIHLAHLMKRSGELDPQSVIVVNCQSGRRSSTAASYLRAHGFADVSDLIGGIAAWQAAGKEIGELATA